VRTRVLIPYGSLKVTSNQSEYHGLIRGLEAAISWGIRRLRVLGDSKLVIDQMTGKCACDNANLLDSLNKAKNIARTFQNIEFRHIPREENEDADRLAYQSLDEY
jgi:ribonuclease HI